MISFINSASSFIAYGHIDTFWRALEWMDKK
jgi:hypothetical protein